MTNLPPEAEKDDRDRALSCSRARRRGLAPLAAAALALLVPASAPAIWPFGGRGYPDPATDLAGAAAEILARVVRIPTEAPEGNERRVAELLVRVAKNEGLEARLITTPGHGRRSMRAAAWARLSGSGARRPILLLSHLDVVPARRDEWTVDPYDGVVGGGFVIGRGALDAKGIAVVHLLAMAELARAGTRLERDVILLAVPDEESGGLHGTAYITRERRELLGNTEFVLAEGGGILLGRGGAPNVWGVTVAEKSPCWMRVTARGTPGHSSTAPQDAAVSRLVAVLDRVRRIETEVRVTPEVARMFAALASLAAPEDRAGFADLETALATDAGFRARFLSDRGRRALVRNTLAITVLEGSPSTNLLPSEAHAHLDARILPGERCEDFVDLVRAVAAAPGVSVEPLLSFRASSSPIETALFAAIRDAAAEVDPGAAVVPRVIAGFTDAHYFRDLGAVAYGFVPRWLPPDETLGIHGPNERISIDNLVRGTRTLARILERLAGGPGD